MFGKPLPTLATVIILMSVGFAQTPKTRILFFGDSITELGVKEKGYVTRIGSLIRNDGLAEQYELVGAGISGNKVYDLYLRLETDVLAKSPDVVVVFVGVNDIWHKRTAGTGTDFSKFGKFYEAIVAKLQSVNVIVVLCTPAVIGEKTDVTNEFDGELNQYSKWIRDFATAKKLPLVDLRKVFIDYDLKNNPENKQMGILTTDGVHLNDAGNDLVAAQIWRVLKSVKTGRR